MSKVQVFEPAMCCSTGVCGPNVDPVLVRFSADAQWLESMGVQIERNNLSGQPQAFAENAAVRRIIEKAGIESLPVTFVDGVVAFQGRYPTRTELAEQLGLTTEPARSIYSEAVAELVAIGAAVAANCAPCFRYHYDRARKLGISREDMWAAVETARSVQAEPARQLFETAARYLNPESLKQSSSCCGSDDELPVVKSKGCC